MSGNEKHDEEEKEEREEEEDVNFQSSLNFTFASTPFAVPCAKMLLQTFTCELCGESGFSEAQMRHHLQLQHLQQLRIDCPFLCGVFTLNEEEMQKHVNERHFEDSIDEFKSSRFGRDDQKFDENIEKNDVINVDDDNDDGDSDDEDCVIQPSPPAKLLKTPQFTSVFAKRQQQLPVFNSSNNNREKGGKEKKNTTTNDNIFECPMCALVCDSAEILNLHMNQTHFESDSPYIASGSASASGSNSISLFNAVAGTEISLQQCPVCERIASTFRGEEEYLRHVNSHFDGEDIGVDVGIEDGVGVASTSNQSRPHNHALLQNSLLTPNAQHIEPGFSATSGILRLLSEATSKGITASLTTSLSSSSVDSRSRSILSEDVTHFPTTSADGGWGCGYRNMQMMLSSLRNDPVFAGIFGLRVSSSLSRSELTENMNGIPSIERIQSLIEEAWGLGFDVQGRDQLGGRLSSTRKWIGATEIFAALSSLGIKTTLVDFHRPTGTNGTHPALFRWVKDYFYRRQQQQPPPNRNSFNTGISTMRHPLYFQHQGHSRTIVGVEEDAQGAISLLLFDPSKSPKQTRQYLPDSKQQQQQSCKKLLSLMRQPLSGLKHAQYQIIAVEGTFESEAEKNAAKIVRSVRIP